MNNTLKPIEITGDDLILIKKLEKEYNQKKKELIEMIQKEIQKEILKQNSNGTYLKT
tara:strand:- start:3908 stop:4078 length:171 start_codon:yes stop_codon:yes gene_type:complete